jgi:transcriptional antiterminator
MSEPAYSVTRVFGNNAVLGHCGDDTRVLVGRGIGFGRRIGQEIPLDEVQHQYFEIKPTNVRYLDLLNSNDQHTLDVCNEAIDRAADVLGELHPSVYLLLVEHLAFTVQRLREGSLIRNPLIDEIRAAFPDEFMAAEVVVRHIDSHLDVELPPDETAFITLHLNAARTDASVKLPLRQANDLAELVKFAAEKLGHPNTSPTVHGELIWTLARLTKRIQAGAYRGNAAVRLIERDLALETEVASQIIEKILGSTPLPPEVVGEVAHLALFLHGWKQDASYENEINPANQKGVTR